MTEEQFDAFNTHFLTRPRSLPPHVFYLTALALIPDPKRIQGCVCTYKNHPAPTVWTAHIVTDRALAVIEAEFDAEQYDGGMEQTYHRPEDLPGARITQAWIRPLSDVVRYEVNVISEPRPTRFGATAAVVFSDGERVQLPPVPSRAYGDDLPERFDRFIEAIRGPLGW